MKKLPVVMHQWFKKGDGWAGHPFLWEKLSEVVHVVNGVLRFPREGIKEVVIPFHGGNLVGLVMPQVNCPDPRAVNRSPFLAIFAFSQEATPSKDTVEDIFIKLLLLNLPEKEGETDSLFIEV